MGVGVGQAQDAAGAGRGGHEKKCHLGAVGAIRVRVEDSTELSGESAGPEVLPSDLKQVAYFLRITLFRSSGYWESPIVELGLLARQM